MFDINTLSENIKKHRKKSGLKQLDVADMLHVSPQAISRWETGLSAPDVENLCTLAEVFNVSVDALLYGEQEEIHLFIGIDGGGTKTEFVLFNEYGNIRKRIVLGGTNPNLYGLQNICLVLKKGIDSLLYSCRANEKVLGIYCGISGAMSGDHHFKIEKYLEEQYHGIPCGCHSDIFNVAASATDNDQCIAVICGTGLNVTAINGERLKRLGGRGYLLEGKGSGYDIGRDALTAVLAFDEGVGQDTKLKILVEKKLGKSVWESIQQIYSADQSFIASFAVDVFTAYKEGDDVAKRILQENMSSITDKINYLVKNFECGDTVIFTGGLTLEMELLREFIQMAIPQHIKILVPDLPQIFGACKCCVKQFGVLKEGFKDYFKDDYQAYLEGEKEDD